MKLLKQLSMAAIAVALAGTASAQTVIHVVGSTAFRAGASMAIVDAVGGASATTTYPGTTARTKTVYVGANNTNYASAGQQVFADGYIGADPNPGNDVAASTIVVTSWTGSLAGVVDLTAQSSAAAFLDITNTTVQSNVNSNLILPASYAPVEAGGAGAGGTGPVTALASGTATTTTIDMAMSDSYQKTIANEIGTGSTFTANVGSYSSGAQLATDIAGTTIIQDAGTSTAGTGAGTAGRVACVPFQWVFSNNTPGTTGLTPPTNITQQLADQIIGAGYAPQSLFTGTTGTGDLHNVFFFTGRNEDSGTRIGYLQESQFGVTATPVQWYFGGSNYENGTSPTNSIATSQPFPIVALNTEPNIKWNTIGHSGYASGADITTFLKVAQTGALTFSTHVVAGQTKSYRPSDMLSTDAGWFLASLGLTDAAGVTAAGGSSLGLKYNGVAYSPAATQSGSYTHWEYEHCYRLKTNAVAGVNAFIDNIADLIYSGDCDVVYVPTGATTGAYHTENSDGTYTSANGLAPGLKLDSFFKAQRTLSEGGPVSATF